MILTYAVIFDLYGVVIKPRVSIFERPSKPVDGIIEVIEGLSVDYQLFVVSSNKTSYIQDFLIQFSLIDYFVACFGSDAAPNKGDVVLDLLAQNQKQRSEVLYVTDTADDVEVMKSVGVACVGITWGVDSAAALQQAGAAIICQDPADIQPSIDHYFFKKA